MNATLIASFAGIISAALMAVISHFLLARREENARIKALKSKINEEQLTAYKLLWSKLGPTSRFNGEATIIKYKKDGIFLDTDITLDFISSIREFFFSENGLFLSKDVRKQLFSLLEILQKLTYQRDADIIILVPIKKEKIGIYRENVKTLIETIRSDLGLINSYFPSEINDK